MSSELQAVAEQLRSIGSEAAASARECDAAARRTDQHIQRAMAVAGTPIPEGLRSFVVTVDAAARSLENSARALADVKRRADVYAAELSKPRGGSGSHGDYGRSVPGIVAVGTCGAANPSQLAPWAPPTGVGHKAASNMSRMGLAIAWLQGFSGATQLSPPEAWIEKVNPGGTEAPGRNANCFDCTRSVALTIEGQPTAACSMDSGVGVSHMEKWTGVNQRTTTPQDLQTVLEGMSEGSYAVTVHP